MKFILNAALNTTIFVSFGDIHQDKQIVSYFLFVRKKLQKSSAADGSVHPFLEGNNAPVNFLSVDVLLP